ncbi:serine/threonine-protein kinase [Vulcaniibacterium gelatinicum]|uniref:serine/threonine-protein kinase n=1 Tax=Vulcaniibacterium gelatinicum TaxID=2598725 RepID=UPI0011CA1971|nr:serine/threonine-protein kinase [Vulcaniibacterium gelatinicum]
MQGPGADGEATATGLYRHAELAPGTVLGGRYRIEALLGVGGMGVVYRATDLALEVPVALKLLRPELMHRPEAFERFRQELLLARQVSSPRVVRIHDLARHEDRWIISMDFIEGESLDRRLDREGRLPPEDALRIARQLAEGLAAAHAVGVVHRDLKPANVLLDAQGNAYISDFGVARSLAGSGRTQSGTVVGTPDYLSPEQARGERVDARSDLYALGLILYEMLAGALPFAGGTVTEALAQRMLRSPPPLSTVRDDLPDWVVRLVDRLLRPQPAHRLPSAEAVIAALDARRVPREGWRVRWQRARGAWIAAGLLVAALAAGFGAWWWQRTQAPAIAASAPLQRVLVMPLADEGTLPQARLVALADALREAIADAGVAVVDRERTVQALRQLDPAGGVPTDPTALHEPAAARRVLQPRLVQDRGRWRVVATLHDAADDRPPPAVAGPDAADPAAALRAFALSAQAARLLGTAAPLRLDLPAPAALDAYGAGLLAAERGELAQAAAQFETATRAAPDMPALWLARARLALATGEQDLAYEAVERGLAAAGATPTRVQRQLAAERALLDGDAPAAIAQWRALLEAVPDDTWAELNLARARGAGGDFAAAIEGLRRLTARDGQDPRAWYELGKFSILHGQAQRAVDEYLLRALVLFKRSGHRYGEAETVNALGIGYARLGQTADAIEQYRKAVELRRALGNRRGLATSLRNLGSVLALTGRFDEAAQHLEQARALYLALGDRAGLAAVENELGLLAEERGDFRTALAAFRRALQAWRQVEDPVGIARALNDIGFAQYQLGAYDDAQVYWQQAADAYAQQGDDTGRVRATQNLGLLALARGRWDEARQLLERAQAEATRRQMHEELAVGHRHLAELEWMQGHLAAAIGHAERAQVLFAQREDPRGRLDAGLLHVRALLAAGDAAQARARLDALEPLLAEASTEQRAIARLLQAQLEDGTAARTALAEAQRLAEASGVRQLQLEIALERARRGTPDPTLDEATATLGHAALRLEWLRLALQAALARKDAAAAVAHYREAAQWLRAGDYLGAAALHGLGAQALALAGDAAGARAAEDKAAQAAAALQAASPRTRREGAGANP